jgi:hypothetical protein
MEMQFYPPGLSQQFAGPSCDGSKWCAALTIDSLAEDPINGTLLNSSCQSQIGSIEYVNFAYITTNGVPNGPPNPKQFNFNASGNPHETGNHTLFMNQGDNIIVRMYDTPDTGTGPNDPTNTGGFEVQVYDVTTGQTGYMVASASNGFGQIQYAPTGSSCNELPYSFHPMYSTSSPQTRVLWAAAGYNVSMDTEIGHYDACSQVSPSNANGNGSCTGLEGNPVAVVGTTTAPRDQEPSDGDDTTCYAGPAVNTDPSNTESYCFGDNVPGWDGDSYQHLWPDGSSVKPTPFYFTTPDLANGNAAFTGYAFNTDLPRNEIGDQGPNAPCNRVTGANCVNPPNTDDGTAASFYPFYSAVSNGWWSSCEWAIGDLGIPSTISTFGGNSTNEFGPLQKLSYWSYGGRGASDNRYNDFNSGVSSLSGLGESCTGWGE